MIARYIQFVAMAINVYDDNFLKAIYTYRMSIIDLDT